MKNTIKQWMVLTLAGAMVASQASAWTARTQEPSDGEIKNHILQALVVDPRVDSAEVVIDVKDGYVTLSGSVHDLAGKNYAVSEAEKIASVKGVIDKLYVSAPWRPDTDIAQDVRHRIVNHSRIRSHGLGVDCSEAEVKLTGQVDAYVEKRLATELASEVRGVRKVTNDMTVRYSPSRSDAEVLGDVKAALALDVYLTGLPVLATVKDGHVSLEGSVGSWYTKKRAESTVRLLPGVRDVKNDLRVVWAENEGTRTAQPVVSDDVLADRIRAQLKRDTRIDSTKTVVTAKNGAVTLSGSIPSSYQKGVAMDDAHNTVGVGWVTDKLVVGALPRSDASILADVAWELEVDYLLFGTGVHAKVKDGVVTLEGKLHSQHQKRHAGDVALRIRGVKRIVNDIEVVGSSKSDKEIADSVRSHLKWNWKTYWVHDEIQASVSGGTVTLTGKVDDWAQRMAAGRIALETPGVWRVYNNLRVGDYPYAWEEWYEVPARVYQVWWD